MFPSCHRHIVCPKSNPLPPNLLRLRSLLLTRTMAPEARGEAAPVYRDASAPVEARVRDLLGRMTLREKAAQMAQIERTVATPRALTDLGAGSVLNAGGSTPRDRASPADWAAVVDGMQRLALSSRLGVPILYGTDAVHGHNNVYGATVFPHNVGLGASRYRSIRSTDHVLCDGRVSVLSPVFCCPLGNRIAVDLTGTESSRVGSARRRRSRFGPLASTGPSHPASP